MQEDLVRVYTGSIVEATFLKELLEENQIGSILRDTLNESVIAGWGSGSPEDAALLYVEQDLAVKAITIINEYMASR